MIYEHTAEIYFDTDGVLIDTKGQFDVVFDEHDGAGATLVYWFCDEWKPRTLLVELVGEKRVQQLEDLVADAWAHHYDLTGEAA